MNAIEFCLMFQHYIFDFDGTLFDTADDVISVLRVVLSRRSVCCERLSKSLIGPRLESIIKFIDPLLSENDIQLLAAEFRSEYVNSSFPLTQPYRGIPFLLSTLRENGKSIYIATNKPVRQVNMILQKNGMVSFFDEVISFDVFPGKKISKREMVEHIVKSRAAGRGQAIMVGDTCDDILAGSCSGISTCGVCYGYGGRDFECEPDFLVKEPSWSSVDDNRK